MVDRVDDVFDGAREAFVRGAVVDDTILRDQRHVRDHRNPERLGEFIRLADTVIFVHDEAKAARATAVVRKVPYRRGDVVGSVERLAFVAADDDEFVGHRARDRRPEAAADDVAQEVEQHIVEVPLGEPPLLEQLKPEGDAAATAAARRLRAAELHAVHAVAFEHHVLGLEFFRLAVGLEFRPRAEHCRDQGPTEVRHDAVVLGIAAHLEDALVASGQLARDHAREERLTRAAFAVDRDGEILAYAHWSTTLRIEGS